MLNEILVVVVVLDTCGAQLQFTVTVGRKQQDNQQVVYRLSNQCERLLTSASQSVQLESPALRRFPLDHKGRRKWYRFDLLLFCDKPRTM